MLINLVRSTKIAAVTSHLFTEFRRRFSSVCYSPSSLSTDVESLSRLALQSLVRRCKINGKFQRLLRNVVASPSLLLTACENLRNHNPESHSVSLTPEWVSCNFFSIHELSFQLAHQLFDVESHCVAVLPQGGKGAALVLPNLKLKVVVEAIRLVLEVIYDDKFVTFSYGGRVNMGRHTAVRYLKNTVENPTWWFCVKFGNEHFETRHVGKLCLMLGERIQDDELVNMIKKLFQFKILAIDLGDATCFSRGLPQECGLSLILINVYFNWFDKEVHRLRLQRDTETPKFSENELHLAQSDEGTVFYKPLKIYAVRYLNEILMITSGTKKLTLDLKSWAVEFLEQKLDLKVDHSETVIHSAVSEKIDFMGMELQAVAPSVLRPTKSEKAIRARKKYLRQKEVRLQELRNARERNRKMLGMKLYNHVFKKLKRSNSDVAFKYDFQIKNEVTQIFSTWADEVVDEYLKSIDDRYQWHRQLSRGDFLMLDRIRHQLPSKLIDAYDGFRDQIDKYLNPIQAKKQLQEEAQRREEEDEERYAKKTIDDLTKKCIKVEAPLELIRKAIRLVGITNQMGRPRPLSFLTVLDDASIIKWYAGIGRRWLDFYCCCHNFRKVKIIVGYHLRFSCILTLAEKHESTKQETIRHFTKDLKLLNPNGTEEVHFPSEREVKMMGDRSLQDPKPVEGCLTVALVRMTSDDSNQRCVAHFCSLTDTVSYRIWLLQRYLKVSPLDEDQWVQGMSAIHDSLHRKCAPLCSYHMSEFYLGKLTFQDLDCTSLIDDQ